MKKYIKFILLFLLILVIVIFIFKKYNSSFDVKPQLKYSELENYIDENNEFLLYVTNNKKVDKEKEYFDSNNIEVIYMYLDKKEIKQFENKYGIKNLPKLVYFKNGYIIESDNFSNINDFLNRNGFLK